jgi:predicted nucleic acid-binding protein
MLELTDENWLKAFQLSVAEDISLYDAVSLGIAEMLGSKLVSSDAALRKRLSNGVRRYLLGLKDWASI